MKSPEEPPIGTPASDQELDGSLPEKPADGTTEARVDADTTTEKEDVSSASSEVDEIGKVTDVSKRRRVQNSQFETLYVLSKRFILTQANSKPGFPNVPNQVLSRRVKPHVQTSPRLSSLLHIWQQGRIWDLGHWILGNTNWNCLRGLRHKIQLQFWIRVCFRQTIIEWNYADMLLGSGKTLIAVLLLKHVIHNELNDRAHGKPHRVSFFLV